MCTENINAASKVLNISVVVPVFNQVHLTERCLGSLLDNSILARELVIIDNNSSDSTPAVLKEFQNRFAEKGWSTHIIINLENVGFGRACNQGIRASSGEFVIILNNDTWLMSGWDDVLLRRMSELGADMVGPYFDESPFDAENMIVKAQRYADRNRGKFSKDWVSILMFFRRQVLEAVGLFDERFFVTYEDTDLRERMDRAGKKYFQVGDCYIWHFSKGTRGSQKLPSNYEQEGLRLFIEKWGFDPCIHEKALSAKLRRKWKKVKATMGLF
ncbi:MAG: glycosyltransferase family 2 protein [Nitrospirota bacterium]